MSGTIILLLAAIFLLAAISKIRDRESFHSVLSRLLKDDLHLRAISPFPPLEERAEEGRPITISLQLLSTLIPALELFLAAWLLSGVAPRQALIASILLLMLFTAILIRMRLRGFRGCGCFGETTAVPSLTAGIVRNLALIAAVCFVLIDTQPISVFGPDISSLLARTTILIGLFCLWPSLLVLIT